jgi:hypothetical protein
MTEKTKPKIGETVFLHNLQIEFPRELEPRSFLPEEISGYKISFPFAGEKEDQPSTEILEQRYMQGVQHGKFPTTPYFLVANAVSYLAKVKLPKSPEKITNLFHGGIQIYGLNNVEKGNSESLYLPLRNGIIYQTTEDIPALLSNIIFGNAQTDTEKEKRIEAILRGYELQEVSERNARSRASLRDYQRGQFDMEESTFGTFGRRR